MVSDPSHASGQRVDFRIGLDKAKVPSARADGTTSKAGARCIACDTVSPLSFVRSEGQAGRIGVTQIAVVADGDRRRTYLTPTAEHQNAALVARPDDVPDSALPDEALGFRVQAYGMKQWADLFTNRQLVAVTCFSDLIPAVREKIVGDGGSEDYANAVATYLAFAVDKLADFSNSLAVWYPKEDRPKNLFALQAIPMVWDFPEVNPFCEVGGSWERCVQVVSLSMEGLIGSVRPVVSQVSAASRDYSGLLVSTDPPYYDNIDYSDLSDFFYVWLRRSLRDIYPSLLSTMLVPKAEELVANPYRHGGRQGAETFFEEGFRDVFSAARQSARDDIPITVYYAFKQSDSDEGGQASTGWETLLEGMIRSGWEITSTWPLRSERGGRSRDVDSNALASSIVLSLRPRPPSAPTTDRRGFIAAMEVELPDALRKLQQGQIAPVDLPQAAIGPGMAVFSRYGAVLEPDGSRMTVRSALVRINEILDQVLNEQEGDFDATSRFALAWYRGNGYGIGKFGDADNIARARNTSVDVMDRDEILTSRAGNVQLIKPSDLPWEYDVLKDNHTSNWEALHHLIKVLERDGIAPAGDFLHAALGRPDSAVDADLVKELAHLLFRIAESNGWTKDALSFNSLVTSWPEIVEVARSAKKPAQAQGAFDFEEDEDE